MKNAPGYPLPDGELGEDEIVCQLVYLPNRPEYWQALLAAIHYFSTWRAWERDEDKRGADAAANWREAFELTIGCWRMTCLQELQEDVAAILAILKLPNDCCEAGDITDGDQYTDRVEDGEDDVPQNIIDAGYAEDAADWDGFDDYKCMIAHLTVDQLSFRLNEIAKLSNDIGGYLGGVAAIAGIVAVIVGTGGLAIVFGIVAGIGATALLYQALTDFDAFEDLVDKVSDNHNALVCSIYYGDGDAGSLASLNNKIDELFTAPEALILKNMNLGPTLKSLYAGRYDQQDIADKLEDAGYETGDFTCDCEQIGEYLTFADFETGTDEGWNVEDSSINHGYGIGGGYAWRVGVSWGVMYHDVATLVSQAGLTPAGGTKVRVHRIKFYNRWRVSLGTEKFKMSWIHDGGSDFIEYDHESDFTEVEEVFDPPLESTHNLEDIIKFKPSVDPLSAMLYIDNVTVDFDFIPAP